MSLHVFFFDPHFHSDVRQSLLWVPEKSLKIYSQGMKYLMMICREVSRSVFYGSLGPPPDSLSLLSHLVVAQKFSATVWICGREQSQKKGGTWRLPAYSLLSALQVKPFRASHNNPLGVEIP